MCATLPLALIPAFNNMGWHLANDLHNQRTMAIVTLVLITVLNVFGIRLVALINNTGVLFEILGMVVFAFILAVFHHHQSAAVIFHTGGTSLHDRDVPHSDVHVAVRDLRLRHRGHARRGDQDPRREAPKAIIASVIGAFVIGAVFLFALLLAIPDLPAAIKGGFGPAQIIDANFGNGFSTVFLLTVAAAIFVCCLAIQTATIRLCFSMARDDHLPGSKALQGVHPGCTRRSGPASPSVFLPSSRCLSTPAQAPSRSPPRG